jgi:hypothetical protein
MTGKESFMENMNLLDITIRYFNVIVFVFCVLFGMVSFFASWIAWREIHRKQNIIRSIVAAYNITEDTLENSRTAHGNFQFDPATVQTVFYSLQEILNAVYGEVTGKSIPPRDERQHGSGKTTGVKNLGKMLRPKDAEDRLDINSSVPTLVPEDRERRGMVSHI